MTIYDRAKDNTLKLLSEYGQPLTLVKPVVDSFDPVEGETTESEPETLTVNGVIKSYSDSVIDGTTILKSDKQLIIPAVSGGVGLYEKAIVAGEEYTIIPPVKTVDPAGVAISHTLQLRK
jgi:hypothetical protein